MNIELIITAISAFAVGALISILSILKQKKTAKSKSKQIIESAEKESERIRRNAQFKAKEEMQNAFNTIKNERRQQENANKELEKKLIQQEIQLKNQIQDYQKKESELELFKTDLIEKSSRYENRLNELNEVIQKEMTQMENVAQFTAEEAKNWIIEKLKVEARNEGAENAMAIKNEMKERATREAKDVLAKAIENMAYEYTVESTLSSIPLVNDRIKGMIIGREGKNIRSIEDTTGVKVIVDETPETVIISCFDPIKRDIASRTITELINNKNINPNEVVRIYKKKKQDVEKEMRRAAADCLRMLSIKNVSDEMFEMLGRLKYRTSYGQNILQHSIEVAKLAGYMAAELGLDVELAKRAGLFHDLGKANSHDAEASHVAIGVEVATKAKEHPVVINAVLSHHEEAEPISPISVLVNAADKISGSRPGARRDSLEQYTNRIESLEKIASNKDGVNKVYALSAGREVRVIVEPKMMSDAQAHLLSSDIAKEIQESMEYPGQIKVTVIRQSIENAMTNTYNYGNGNGGGNGNGNRKNKNKVEEAG